MGRHSGAQAQRIRTVGDPSIDFGRHVRNPHSLPIFAFVVAAAMVLISVIAPNQRVDANLTTTAPAHTPRPAQTLAVGDVVTASVTRDTYSAKEKPKPPPPPPAAAAPVAGTPDPGTAKAIALEMVTARGWGSGEYDCLVSLWQRESGWNHYAHNPSSGAYGIPQALPGNKMATHGADWQTNPRTQISWGLAYIESRYGTPCGAWNAFLSKGWY